MLEDRVLPWLRQVNAAWSEQPASVDRAVVQTAIETLRALWQRLAVHQSEQVEDIARHEKLVDEAEGDEAALLAEIDEASLNFSPLEMAQERVGRLLKQAELLTADIIGESGSLPQDPSDELGTATANTESTQPIENRYRATQVLADQL